MAVTLTINGVDRSDMLRDGSLDIDKDHSSEVCTLMIVDRSTTLSAGSYRPQEEDVIRLVHNGTELLFGGPIVTIEPGNLGDKAATKIRARDWMFLAGQVRIDFMRYAAQDALTLFDTLVATYLVPKGVSNIGATTGGPIVPDLVIEGETLLEVFNRLTEQTGWPFRINGDKECALVEPGLLVGPEPLTVSNMLEGGSWSREGLFSGNVLYMFTGTPESGAGPVSHSETHFGDGIKTTFPINVVPNHARVALVNNSGGYSAGATSLALDGLTPGMVLAAGNSLTRAKQTSEYVIQSDVTVDDQGAATVTIAPGLDGAVPDDGELRLSFETGMGLTVNGTPTAIDGTTWDWDPVDLAVVKVSGSPPASGAAIAVSQRVTFPAQLRVWETASVAVQDSFGAFDRAVMVVGEIASRDHTDLAQAAAYMRDVLSKRVAPPQVVTATSFVPGWYPYLSQDVTDVTRGLTGTFLVTRTRIQGKGIDPASTSMDLAYGLELVQGDKLRESWQSFYRGDNPTLSVRWGVLDVDARLAQAVIEVMVFQQNALLSQGVVEVAIRNTAAPAQLAQAVIEVMVA